jgi:hypothetical protein
LGRPGFAMPERNGAAATASSMSHAVGLNCASTGLLLRAE